MHSGGVLRVDVAWGDASAGRAVTLDCLLGVDGPVEFVDPVDELGVGGDEPGASLLYRFEFPDLASESGLFPSEVVGVRLSELAPGVVRLDEDGGAGVQVLAVAASSEDPLAGVLGGAAKVLVVDPSGALKVLVARSDGGPGPTTGTGLKVGEVPFDGGSLVA
jgi:hypothetical protein